MLDKLRRKSKHDAAWSKNGAGPQTPKAAPRARSCSAEEITFFSLPAELRNVIYEEVARNTLILIPSGKEKATKQLPPIPSLLIASQKTRNEYLPLLLECARMRVVIKHYDFQRLMRVCRSLYSTELKALRKNGQLTIELVGDNCTKESLVALRRWLENRGRGLDRLPWNYVVTWRQPRQLVPTSAPVCMANGYIQRKKVITQNLEALSQLYRSVGEMVGFELLSVIDAFQSERWKMGGESKTDDDASTAAGRASPSRG